MTEAETAIPRVLEAAFVQQAPRFVHFQAGKEVTSEAALAI
jgi:hypothetical protein